jgi:hypothetical protein
MCESYLFWENCMEIITTVPIFLLNYQGFPSNGKFVSAFPYWDVSSN